jgi:hypothetical protein
MRSRSFRTVLGRTLVVLGLPLLVAACGSDCCEHEDTVEVLGDIDVYNATADELLIYFGVGVSGTGTLTDDLVPDLPPGHVAFAGSFYEDFYDAEADLEDGLGFVTTIGFANVFVEAGFVTEFEVF